jgi:cell division protein FtsL
MRLIMALLILLVFASALAVVYARHTNRKEFAELQQLRQHRDALNVEWGRLELEQSTWATHARIEQTAHRRLDMVMPHHPHLVVVKSR